VPKKAANVALFVGVVLIAFLTFGDSKLVAKVTCGMNIYHVDTVVFLILVAIMGIWSIVAPRKEAFIQQDVKAVDMTPWKLSWVAGGLLFILVGAIYITFGSLDALTDNETEPVRHHWELIANGNVETEMNALGFTEEQQTLVKSDINHMIKFLAAGKVDQGKIFGMVADYFNAEDDPVSENVEVAAEASGPNEIVYLLISEYKDKDGNFSINGDTELTNDIILRIILQKYAEINSVPADKVEDVKGLITKIYADFKLPEEERKALKNNKALNDLKKALQDNRNGSIIVKLFEFAANTQNISAKQTKADLGKGLADWFAGDKEKTAETAKDGDKTPEAQPADGSVTAAAQPANAGNGGAPAAATTVNDALDDVKKEAQNLEDAIDEAVDAIKGN